MDKRAEPARYIDDASRKRIAQQRQHGLGHRQCAEEIGVEDVPHGVDAGSARWAIGPVSDAGIIHQHVEPTVVSLDTGRGGLNRFHLIEVDVDETNVGAFALEGDRRGFTEFHIASTEQYDVAGLAELTGDFKANTLLGAGDHCDA